ncbi:3-deoxy-8-phosphooctulonate synthase [Sphingomonas agri]|uniref:3-deoxy-8-phosphooctulonate synthase n=1 Tax=Sphingomonas agri TaxID=1813878 RepID=UPI00311DB24D
MPHTVTLQGGVTFANDRPFVLIGGMNVIEDEDTVMAVASRFVAICTELEIPYVFKASFDKANRSSIKSFRGPGLERGLEILAAVKERFGVPVLTDVHEPYQAAPVAKVVDILQLPAFLARQTDLVSALAETGRPINIKKPQFLAPQEMQHIINKCREAGNSQVILCERGSSFGYNNLVVDMLGMDLMKDMAPVVFDATHALQKPGGRSESAGGRRAQATALARSGMALGIAGLFLEAHPDPDKALCDGPCALPLDALRPYLEQMKAVDRLVKSFSPIVTG